MADPWKALSAALRRDECPLAIVAQCDIARRVGECAEVADAIAQGQVPEIFTGLAHSPLHVIG